VATKTMTKPHQSKKIVIIGAGLMGCGIAQVFARKGIPTVICDPMQAARESACERIRDNLNLLQQDHGALDYISVAEDFTVEARDADVVIEAVPEKLGLKKNIFSELVFCTPEHCILASNTSVIPIRDIAKGLEFCDRIIGTHWWNPPYLVPLVEVVQSDNSALKYVEQMITLLEWVDKKPIHVKKDITGFVANRMQHALWREAIALIDEGVCDAETVDVAVKNSFGMRLPVLGPIENADMVGLDLTQDIHNVVLADICRDTAPAKILQSKIAAGDLGMKTGRGFKSYTQEEAFNIKQKMITHLLKTLE
jgi:3-hydroxybutyryl-CoA dehydrogenase